MTGGLIVIHPKDAHMLNEISRAAATWGMSVDNSPPPDLEVNEGDVITVGTIEFKVLHTPGHTPGGISLYADNIVLVGDTLFAGSIGRTDFPGGDYQALISNVRDKLFPLGDDVQAVQSFFLMRCEAGERKGTALSAEFTKRRKPR